MMRVVALFLLLLGAVWSQNDYNYLEASKFAGVCPGLKLPPPALSEADKMTLLTRTMADRRALDCKHVVGNLELDLSTHNLVVLFAGAENGTVGVGYNMTRTITGYLYVRVGDFGERRFVDMYGLTFIEGEETWNGCHLVIEYVGTDADWKGGFLAETLDLEELTICSFRSELDADGQPVSKTALSIRVFHETRGGGMKVLGMKANDGSLIYDTSAGLLGEFVFQYDENCVKRGLKSVIANYPDLPLDDPCCPADCAHGCVYEANPELGKVARKRCSSCKPDAAGSPRYWNDYAAACDVCDTGNRIGLICIRGAGHQCIRPLVTSKNKCAYECSLDETLNMLDGSCVPCAWSFDKNRFAVGNEGCDPTCAVMGSLNYLTTSGLKRFSSPVNNSSRNCRILTGNLELNPTTLLGKGTPTTGIVTQLITNRAFYGNVQVLGLVDGAKVECLKSAVQIVGDLKLLNNPGLTELSLESLQKMSGEYTAGGNPAMTNGQALDAITIKARDSAKNQGLLASTAEMNSTDECYEACPQNCVKSSSKASWGCTVCTSGLSIDLFNLFTCVAATECPGGFYRNETKCLPCHYACYMGCKGEDGTVGSHGCNSCQVYVAQQDGIIICKSHESSRCKISDCSLNTQKMIDLLEPFDHKEPVTRRTTLNPTSTVMTVATSGSTVTTVPTLASTVPTLGSTVPPIPVSSVAVSTTPASTVPA